MSARTACWDIAHEWATRQDGTGIGAAGHMLYGNGCIYSYGDHFMIARHVTNESGEQAVLFTERTYSHTTAKHIKIVRDASSHLDIINVADPAYNKDELFTDWQERLLVIAEKLANAKRPAKYTAEMESLYKTVQAYADFFGYEIPEWLQQVGNIRNSEQYQSYLAKQKAERELQDIERKKREKKYQASKLKKWRAFEQDFIGSLEGWDYLRLNTESGEVETTQAFRFSLNEGKALYHKVKVILNSGNVNEFRETFLGRYPILEVSKAGIRIGCHRVAIKEVNRLARSQEWDKLIAPRITWQFTEPLNAKNHG